MLVREIGYKGQVRLSKSRVAIVGCGATGSFMATLLARLGVGYLRVIDRDIVELSNLHRTLLHDEGDVERGMPKAISCIEKIKKINSGVDVDAVVDRLTRHNGEKLLTGVDLILDGTDDVETRLLINDVAVKYGIPWIHVGVERWYGMVLPVIPGKTACYRCLIDKPPERRGNACEYLGVVNTAVAMTISIAVSLALRILLGEKVDSELYMVDSWRNEVSKIKVMRNPRCPACVLHRYDYLEGGEEAESSIICGSNQVEILPSKRRKIDISKLIKTTGLNVLRHNEYVALIKFKGLEFILFNDGRAIVTNTVDREKAEKHYRELIRLIG